MGDCNFPLNYPTPESKEKVCTKPNCKYSYASWCATCEKTSPRRRSKSETTETCRKKCREMKSLTPRKYDKSTEYENMDLEFDYKGWHDTKYAECCRIRSNLVELPTSYISNNCQSMSTKTDTEIIDCLKGVKSYEQTCKYDLNDRVEPMDHFRNVNKFNSCTEPSLYNGLPKTNGFTVPKSRISPQKDNQVEENSNLKRNCKVYCTLADFKCHEIRPPCYDTDTYFDKQLDREKYSKEVDYLREKLRILQNAAYVNYSSSVNVVQNGELSLRDTLIANPIEIKPMVRKEKVKIVPGLVKTTKSKIALKTKKANLEKIRKSKSKALINPLANESDGSGEDSDVVEDDPLEEEPSSITSEPSSSSEVSSTKDSTDTTVSTSVSEKGSGDFIGWPVRPSLFPNIPPYIKFRSYDTDVPYRLPTGKKYFKWKLSTITPIIVRKTLQNSGFALVRSEFSRESNQWLGTWGKHMKSPMFKTLKETQKLNHFPGTFQLGRKDRLWKNFQRMINKFGIKEFGFLPHTYCLPQELKLLKQNWEFKNGSGGEMWIIKPPASARGVGIKVINKWSQLPKKTSLVVQKYINNPYLINGSKFDLRLYVLVTSFHPLRIYLYPDGLARFASAKYSDDVRDLKDRYMHLTNYSINKLSSQYTTNEDANACHGHKWTLSKLMEYMHSEGVDTKTLWKNLQQLVIKTIISSESLITPLCEENMNNYYNCYELFGIDVLLDEHLKPWLLEVNISPSLHSASPLDAHVKGPLVQTLFDIAQFHFPQKLAQYVKGAPVCFEPKMYARSLTKKERSKHVRFTQFERRQDYLNDILEDLTGDDIRHLVRSEDEFVVKGSFERIFPTEHTYPYLEFMEARYYNRLFDAWEHKFGHQREDGIALLQNLCAQKLHLKVAPPTIVEKNLPSTTHGEIQIAKEASAMAPSLEGNTNNYRPIEEVMQNSCHLSSNCQHQNMTSSLPANEVAA